MKNETLKINRNKTESDRLKACLIPTFIIGLIAHAYGFLHNIFSHDALNAFYADADEERWKVALGRFLVPVVRKLLTGSVALPWVIGLLSLALISLSMYFIIKMFDLDYKQKLPITLISGIMVTNITVTAGVATYIYELHFDMLALLLACIAAYIWSQHDELKWYALSALTAVASIALYQSYFEVTLLLMILYSVYSIFEGSSAAKAFVKALKGLITAVAAFAVYYGLYKFVTMTLKIEPEGRTFSFAFDSLAQNIVTMFKRIAAFYLKPASVYPSVVIAIVNVLIILMTVVLVLTGLKKLEKNNLKEKILVVFLGIAAVISINVIGITGAKIHDLMVYAYWIIFAFLIILLCKNNFEIGKGIKIISFILVGIFIWNNILVANTAYIKRDNEQGAVLSALTRVVNDLEKRDDYEIGKSEIIFYGHIDSLKIDEEKEFESVNEIEGMKYKVIMGGIEPDWYYNCYETYFKYFLDYPLNYSSKTFSDREDVQNMPCFPEEGYIRNIDGVIVVKLGSIDNMLKIKELEELKNK